MFDVQATLYGELKKIGADVRGEVSFYCKAAGPKMKRRFPKNKERCRFDLVIFNGDKKAVHIIEVKSNLVRHINGVENLRQSKQYRRFGIPVTFVYGFDDVYEFVKLWGSK